MTRSCRVSSLTIQYVMSAVRAVPPVACSGVCETRMQQDFRRHKYNGYQQVQNIVLSLKSLLAISSLCCRKPHVYCYSLISRSSEGKKFVQLKETKPLLYCNYGHSDRSKTKMYCLSVYVRRKKRPKGLRTVHIFLVN